LESFEELFVFLQDLGRLIKRQAALPGRHIRVKPADRLSTLDGGTKSVRAPDHVLNLTPRSLGCVEGLNSGTVADKIRALWGSEAENADRDILAIGYLIGPSSGEREAFWMR
jgi:hypothetical protein